MGSHVVYIVILAALQGLCLGQSSVELQCPSPEWEDYDAESCLLYKPKERKTYQAAKKACWDEGGYLTTIHNDTENEYILSVWNNKVSSELPEWRKRFHIGFTRMPGDNTEFMWLDRSEVNYTNWRRDPWRSSRQLCTRVRADTGKWNAYGCYDWWYYRSGYICRAKKVVPNTWEEYGGKEYLFSRAGEDHNRDWHSARRQCNERGGYLASIHSDQELDFIIQQFNSHGYHGDFWIGLSKLGDQTGYSWTDGIDNAYVNWLPGQPSQYAPKRQLCAFTTIENEGTWHNNHCSEKKGFVCKREPGNTQPIIPLASAVTDGFCPTGYIGLDNWNLCYKIVALTSSAGVTWNEANTLCRDGPGLNAELASIHNLTEHALILSQLWTAPTDFWIGLYQDEQKTGWRWLDNGAMHWQNWAPDYPIKDRRRYQSFFTYYFGSGGSDDALTSCGAIGLHPKGAWINIKCAEKRGYICQAYKNPENINRVAPSPSPISCKPGWRPFHNGCYKVLSATPRSWHDAETACRVAEQGFLVSVLDEAENAFLHLLTRSINTNYWLGFSKSQEFGTWSWVDGWYTLVTPWGPDEPRAQEAGGCAASDSAGIWYDRNCTDLLPAICKINKVPVVTAAPAVSGTCPEGENWVEHASSCFYVRSTSSDRLDWHHALDVCLGLGATLASIHAEPNNHFIMTVLKERNNWSQHWIGLFRSKQDGSWRWSDDSPLQYDRWAPGEPTEDTHPPRDCAVLQSKFTLDWPEFWITKPCNESHPFVCQRPKVPHATKPSHVEGNCPDEEWDDYGESCFLFRPDDLSMWSTATEACASRGGRLAMVPTKDIQDHLYAMQKKSTHKQVLSPYWIGMRKRRRDEPYLWVDGSRPDWTYWAQGEPNDISGRENCVSVTPGKGYWNDTDCYLFRGYVCQANKTLLASENKTTVIASVAPQVGQPGVGTGTLALGLMGGACGLLLLVVIVLVCRRYGTPDVLKKGISDTARNLGFDNPLFNSPSPTVKMDKNQAELTMET